MLSTLAIQIIQEIDGGIKDMEKPPEVMRMMLSKAPPIQPLSQPLSQPSRTHIISEHLRRLFIQLVLQI